MRRVDKLNAIREFALDGNVLACFYLPATVSGYHNLRELRLMVLQGSVVHLMPGTIVRHETYGQKLRFASRGLCRISNGKRRGMFVDPIRLRVGENGAKAGLVKSLDRGTGSLRTGNMKDAQVIDRLYKAIEDLLECDDLIAPSFHIRTSNILNLSLRLRGEVTKQLMELEGYDQRLALDDNFNNLGKAFAIREPGSDGDQMLYPFDMVSGLGLIMFDADTLPPAQLLPPTAPVFTGGDDLLEVIL